MPYQVPDPFVVAIVDAPPTPAVVPSPDGRWLLLVHYEAHPPISLLGRPFRPLAGIRIDPELQLRRRTMLIKGLSLVATATGETRRLGLPGDPSVGLPSWAPDSTRFAFTLDATPGLQLWVGDTSGELTAVPDVVLTDVLTGGQLGGPAPFRWSRDSGTLLVMAIPDGRQDPPDHSPEPEPSIQETSGKRTQMATFADMLTSDADADAFEVYGTTQLVRVDADSLKQEALGEPGLLMSAVESPDGGFLLVERLQRPFSFRVPYPYFARRTEVWAAGGDLRRTVADLPVSDEVPSHGVPTGPRSVVWSESSDARLRWVEARDGGDPKAEVEHRDALLVLDPPFEGEPREWHRLKERYAGGFQLEEPGAVLVREHDRDRRWLTTHLLHVDDPSGDRVVHDRAVDDAYGDPGDPVPVRRTDGRSFVLQDGDRVFVAGEGATAEGNQPFVGWLDLASGEVERTFQTPAGTLDHLVAVIGQGEQIVVRHESPAEPPNIHVVDLTSGDRRPLTDFPHPHPQVDAAEKRLVTYDRGDGVQLSGMLHLPPGHDPADGPLPLLIWAYPDDFGTAGTAGQVRTSPGAFTRLAATHPVWFTMIGFAVLMDATMPVIGDPDTMNDTFVEQITMAAKAHIDHLAEQGLVDPTKVIAAGHSYGGFMTANLLAHTDLFAAGIARSGAYNRSLTPFGFQAERRHFWEAKDVYDRLSPFRYADQITDPLLLIHGAADNNPGTYTIQSERLFAAIQATGGTARLVLLPHESHGYQARESVLHVLAEQFAWAREHTA